MISRLVVIVGLILLAYLAYKASTDKPDLAAEYRYAVTDSDEISRINLMDRNGEEIILERQGDYWTYDGRYRVRKDAIDNLLNTISRMELQYIPRPQALPTIVKGLSSVGIKVSIYDARDQLLKSYYIGGSTPDERGTYIVMAESDHPAVVSLPNFEGSLRPRFWMQPYEWRDRIIFRLDPDNIRELTVNYPRQPEHSFIIREDQEELEVLPYHDDVTLDLSKEKSGAVEAYLRGFSQVGAEALLPDMDLRDSLVRTDPFVHFSVVEKNGGGQQLSMYPIAVDPEGSVRDKLERYYAIDGNGEVYLTQHLVFKKLFWGLDFFFEEVQ